MYKGRRIEYKKNRRWPGLGLVLCRCALNLGILKWCKLTPFCIVAFPLSKKGSQFLAKYASFMVKTESCVTAGSSVDSFTVSSSHNSLNFIPKVWFDFWSAFHPCPTHSPLAHSILHTRIAGGVDFVFKFQLSCLCIPKYQNQPFSWYPDYEICMYEGHERLVFWSLWTLNL